LAFTALDARMGEIFWGVYQKNSQGLAQLVGQEAVTPAEDIVFPEGCGHGIGSGWGVYEAELTARLGDHVTVIDADVWPHAASIVQLAADDYRHNKAVAPERAMPVYLRDKVAKKESERR